MDPELSKIKVEVSARHVHLAQEDQDVLFGKDYEMNQMKDLSQTGQWAADESVTVKGPKGELKTRVLGPCRKQTQVELSRTDCFKLGLYEPEVRLSGNLEGTPGCELIGPKGSVTLKEGVIVPLRHIHISDEEAEARGLKTGDIKSVRVGGERAVIFEQVHVRTHPSFRMALHLDTDEGNTMWADKADNEGEIIDL